MNIMFADKHFQPILFTYPFQLSSEYVLKLEFKPKCAYKNALILLTNRKNCQRWGLHPQTPALALRHYSIPDCALNYKPAGIDIKGIMMEQNK